MWGVRLVGDYPVGETVGLSKLASKAAHPCWASWRRQVRRASPAANNVILLHLATLNQLVLFANLHLRSPVGHFQPASEFALR